MCGIAGIFGSRLPATEINRILERTILAQRHRGPDEQGAMCFEPLGAGLASARLSLVDLEHGSQPVANEDGGVYGALNGEIYNHPELREQLALKGHRFRGHSDTEVLVHLYEEHGDAFLERLEGMFGLAVLDIRRGRLLLARDGPGMKPLCMAETSHGFLFASEVKALFATGLVSPAPDSEAIDAYLAAGYVPAPMSMFRGIQKLEAGQWVAVDRKGINRGRFWQFRYRQEPVRSGREYADNLEDRLKRAVQRHLAADVPVGAFLSGGWDSSLVTAYAVQEAGSRLKTFSVIFPDDPGMDESRHSRLMAKELGTDHHEIEYRAGQLAESLPALVRSLEEPCTTAPAGVVYQLASLAARQVKSVVSGEGADELFGGYEWVRLDSPYLLRRLAPKWPFRAASGMVSHPRWRRALRILGAEEDRMADFEWRRSLDPALKRSILKTEYQAGGPDLKPLILSEDTLRSCTDSLQRRLAFDFTARLRDGILYISDRVGMAHSLEIRMPFLDKPVIDFALGLPSRWKVHRGKEKRILADLARRRLPPSIAQRRKHGLGYPKDAWRREPLHSFARQVLLDGKDAGPFDRKHLEDYLNELGRRPATPMRIAPFVFLQCWWNEFIS